MKSNGRVLLAGVVLLGSCAAPAPAPEAAVDLDAQRAALRAAADSYHDAAQSSEFDHVRSLYASDARIFPPNAPESSGAAGVDSFLEAFTSMPGLQITFDAATVDVGPEGGMGFTIAPAVIRFEGPDGETVEESVRDLHIWRRDAEGNWKVVVDMWNSDTPLPGAEP